MNSHLVLICLECRQNPETIQKFSRLDRIFEHETRRVGDRAFCCGQDSSSFFFEICRTFENYLRPDRLAHLYYDVQKDTFAFLVQLGVALSQDVTRLKAHQFLEKLDKLKG